MRCTTFVALIFATVLVWPNALAVAETPMCLGQAATIVGTDGRDTLVGTDGADVIWSGPGSDTVDGLAGDDLICLSDPGDPSGKAFRRTTRSLLAL